MVKKIPPPPPIASQTPEFNRWLLELTAILNASGGIDPGSVTGLVALEAQVTTNTGNITTLQGQMTTADNNITTLQGQMTTANSNITTINGEITTINGEITTLQSFGAVRNGSGVPAAGLGNNGDLYLNNTGGSGTRLYGKVSGAWVAIA